MICKLAAMAILIAIAVQAPSAQAAPSKFISESCDFALPGGNPPNARFVVNPGVPMTPFQNCASAGGAIGITETGPASSTFAFWSIEVPATPGGYVESVAISAAGCGFGAANNHTFVYEQGWPANCAGESQRVFRVSSLFGGGDFSIFMNCDGNVGPCGAGPTVWAHYIAATQVDPSAPTLAAPQGSVLAGGVLRGDQGLSVEAADKGGGVSRIEVSVNGLPAGQPTVANCNLAQVKNPSYEGTVALSPRPCPAKLKATWELDTASYPFHDGSNTLQVCALDYSSLTDANKTCSTPQTVTIDNSCTESAVPGGEVISAQFARTHREEVTVPFATAAKVVGELSNNAGDAISGATICVQMQTQGSRRGLQPVATATTDARGHFIYKVAPGPNRKVLIGYRHNTFQVARAIRYYAHARPSIKITPGKIRNGSAILIQGKLPGGHQARGRVVVYQASALRSSRWYTFGESTTNSEGVYHFRYRLDETTRTTIYRMRAVVPKQRDWPWEVGYSKPTLVEVRG